MKKMSKLKAWIIVILSSIFFFLVALGGFYLIIKFIKFAWGQ
jgi:hypothetical protein